jgi:hypothetical protein
MKIKALSTALTLGFVALCASAQTVDTTKVKLTNGVELVSATAPKPSGSMLLVKNLSDGSLTAVPVELVANVTKTRAGAAITMKDGKTLVPASRLVTNTNTGAKSDVVMPTGLKVSGALTAAKMGGTLAGAGVAATLAGGKDVILTGSVSAAKARGSLTGNLTAARAAAGFKTDSVMMTSLSPGQTIFLGSTGGTTAAATQVGTTVVSATAATSGLSPNAISASSLGRSIQDQIFVGDLPRLTPNAGLTVGMVTPTTGEVVIGPNGFPTPVTATSAAGSVSIGPNGFPDFAAARGASAGSTPAAGSLSTASRATAVAAGALAASGTAVGTTSAAAPAAASPR